MLSRQGAGRGRRAGFRRRSAGAARRSRPSPGRSMCRRGRDWSRDGARPIASSPSAPRRQRASCRPRVIRPEQVGQETRGKGTNIRHVRNILPETEPAESLLVVEVITPVGHWSSYPPHKHDRDELPRRVAAGRDLLPPPQPAAGLRASSASTRTTARSTRRWRSSDGDVVLVPRATTRSARRTATSSIIST